MSAFEFQEKHKNFLDFEFYFAFKKLLTLNLSWKTEFYREKVFHTANSVMKNFQVKNRLSKFLPILFKLRSRSKKFLFHVNNYNSFTKLFWSVHNKMRKLWFNKIYGLFFHQIIKKLILHHKWIFIFLSLLARFFMNWKWKFGFY